MNAFLKLIFQLFFVLILSNPLHASESNNLEKVLNNNFKIIIKSSSRTIKYSQNENEKISSLNSLKGNMSIEARGTIASLLETKLYVSNKLPNLPNLARNIIPYNSFKNSYCSCD